MPEESLKLFLSYSHKDETLKDELANHLSTLRRQGVISSWDDRKIRPGEEWDHQINENLNTADIILLLVSSDFIASDYCWDVEVTTAIQRHNTGKARVIPIILRRVDWSHTPFAKLQFLPKNAEPVTSWTNRDDAFTNVAQGIRAAAGQLKSERQQKLTLATKETAIAEYRQKVEEFADDGEISLVESKILKHLQEQLGLTDEEARTVRDKVLEPYGKYRENLDQYKQIFTELVDEQGYPLGEKAKADLKKLQQYLKLKDEDVALSDKEAEDQKQPTQTTTAKPIQETDNLLSEKGVDYTQLRDLLKAEQWEEADKETLAVMLKATGREQKGWLDSKSINNLPCTDLRTIDQLCVKYSDGHFGFSVQKRILESVGKDYQKFGDRVGWRKGTKWLFYSDLILNSKQTSPGHLPAASLFISFYEGWSPQGHDNNSFEYYNGEGLWGWGVPGFLFSRVETCKL